MISLLVVSPSYSIREMLARYLPYNEFTVYTVNSDEGALIYLESMPLDAVLIELQLLNSSGLDLLQWLNENHPNIHPVILCEEDDEDLIETIRVRKASYLIKNKLNLLEFRNKLQMMCKYKRGLTYQFQQVSLFELVKLVSFSGYDYHLYLTSPQTHQEGLIYFGAGKVQNAMYGELSGESAFYEIMKMKRGLFSELQVIETDDEDIHTPLDMLMANSALLMDEEDENTRQVKLPPTSCLIVSHEIQLPTFLGELFRFNKDSVLITNWANNIEDAEKELLNNPELMIIDTDHPDVKPKRLVDFINGNYLDTRVILMGEVKPNLAHILKNSSVVRFFEKPIQYQELAEVIEQTYLSQQFSGELLDLFIFGVLQIFSYFRHPRLLEVTDFFSGQMGQIFMCDGEVLHATFGSDIGRDALKKILKINYGVYRQEPYWEPVTKSLNIPFDRLMMYLSRFLEDRTPWQEASDLLLQSGEVISIRSDKIDSMVDHKPGSGS